MPDLATELSHLELADKHIAKARFLNGEARERAKDGAEADLQGGGDSLEVMTETLAAFESHRMLILQTIEDIRAGQR